MEKSEILGHLKIWIRNLREARKTHFSEGARQDSAPVRYLDGGIEAYQRVLDTIGGSFPPAPRRPIVLEMVARSTTGRLAALPDWARWELHGISFEEGGVWYTLDWWEITDYVINRRIELATNVSVWDKLREALR